MEQNSMCIINKQRASQILNYNRENASSFLTFYYIAHVMIMYISSQFSKYGHAIL